MHTPSPGRINRALLEESLANLDSPTSTEPMVTPPRAMVGWTQNAYQEEARALILPPPHPPGPGVMIGLGPPPP